MIGDVASLFVCIHLFVYFIPMTFLTRLLLGVTWNHLFIFQMKRNILFNDYSSRQTSRENMSSHFPLKQNSVCQKCYKAKRRKETRGPVHAIKWVYMTEHISLNLCGRDSLFDLIKSMIYPWNMPGLCGTNLPRF